MNKLYFSLPYPLQYITTNLFGLTIRYGRFNKEFYKALDRYLSLDRQEKCGLDMQKVIEMAKGSRFYSIKDEKDFQNSPIVTKNMVKENYDKIINPEYVHKINHTSGTTGSGLNYPVSKEFVNNHWAIYWKSRYLFNLTTDTWCAYIIGRNVLNTERKKPPYWIKCYPVHQYLFSNAHLNINTVELYLKKIKKSRIYWMHGFPSSLNYLAGLIKDRKLQTLAKELNLKIITTSSETLFDFQKKNIEEIFGCQVRQLYGQTEGVANIFECEEGTLHIDESFSYVEFERVENSCEDYKIIGTTYINKAFPLIRYDTGDTVKLYKENFVCKCGRKSRVVKEIIGREQDYLILDDGTKIGGSGFFFKKIVNVKRAQIVQKQKGEATFYIVKSPDYSAEEEQMLKEEIENRLGKNFRYTLQYTDELIRLKNGKMKFVINEIDGDSKNGCQKVHIDEEGIADETKPHAHEYPFWKNGFQILLILFSKKIGDLFGSITDLFH
ncbi:MAG: phenylacetate--CoA ligase family protein [Ignavibacteria bacterium]|jgi:phenylacetate-CoA ligase|nr:phenylacetate--CoA ligase family protein [Ignavibacteria bacterium]MCU7504425.1 phenylacetate--CoA ligase family protein [Ignavibacteria bacterium]MCU7517484.1 phenylacetate--CoA ligase family protein [Ignavibacteria bacterium]